MTDRRDPYGRWQRRNAAAAAGQSSTRRAKQPQPEFDWDKAIALFKGTLSTHCRKGLHLFTEENTYINARTGHRRCRACINQARRTKRARKATDGHPL